LLSHHTEGERWSYSREAYLAKAERTLEYIRAGDIFQANIARRCRVPVASHPYEIYERLQEVNPSTFAAYLPLSPPNSIAAPAAIVSASPELFLQLRSGTVTTRPIKGTRPRGVTPGEDEQARRALAGSIKDRAELNMIIDLERNDLGRVCEYGTVRVESDGDIEALPTVFHRTATITGRLRQDADVIDLLRATFPGGSITGAPKVRAMQIINELEPAPRGPYCGAIGYLGLNGEMMLNLAIRTLVIRDGAADVMVGSGIVADSEPEEEYAELEAKAAGMFAALRLAADRRPAGNATEQIGCR
jgi:para-aminobenzoate synthetase component 1